MSKACLYPFLGMAYGIFFSFFIFRATGPRCFLLLVGAFFLWTVFCDLRCPISLFLLSSDPPSAYGRHFASSAGCEFSDGVGTPLFSFFLPLPFFSHSAILVVLPSLQWFCVFLTFPSFVLFVSAMVCSVAFPFT